MGDRARDPRPVSLLKMPIFSTLQKIFRLSILPVFIFVSVSTRLHAAEVPSPENIVWTEEELAQDISIRLLKRTDKSSHHMIRLKGSERPHVHQTHDLSVRLIKGSVRVYVEDRWIEMKAGDKLEIPKNTLHWAENTALEASEAYAVFSPPLDERDTLTVIYPEGAMPA